MSKTYNYAEEIPFSFEVLKPEDYKKLQAFSCGNKVLDKFIHEEVVIKGNNGNFVNCEDGLHFKIENTSSKEVIGFVSLASSGIVYKVDNYTHVYPAIKVDVFAIDTKYQKMHYDIESAQSSNPDDHYYFSDEIMGCVISHIYEINEKHALVNYVILYADKDAERFYRRNGFEDFSEFMVKEENQEINENIPMFFTL